MPAYEYCCQCGGMIVISTTCTACGHKQCQHNEKQKGGEKNLLRSTTQHAIHPIVGAITPLTTTYYHHLRIPPPTAPSQTQPIPPPTLSNSLQFPGHHPRSV
ncbi:hypothetical protein L249_2632 [Ophiocordyceps polyrhachis-furcata BCC 54312]|uniref:Uncharacterized protein n=1 Tax=Ophiocordyceps polyrhachis-furcata BCC 54312 TaxID=1330021 RepID=A0A367LS53_9HYPO|nr:hypothetical protein L249_2632 [Ophiocordyceps polyrhachis-furcata BCC 54312]